MNKSKMEMKVMRDFLRRQMKHIRNDPFCRDFAPYLSARIVSWSRHGMLICVHDNRAPFTNYNSLGCRWCVCRYGSDWERAKVWQSLNQVCVDMRLYLKYGTVSVRQAN